MSQEANSEPTRPPARSGTGDQHGDTVLLTNPTDSFDQSGQPCEASPSEATAAPIFDPDSPRLARMSGRYDILGEAGHGSMGNVYKALDRETGEIVALKLLKPEIASDQTMMERFKNELLFARKITHKNVCRMYDFNRIDGVAYTSMEFVDGESLRSVLNRFGGLPVRKAVGVALQICSGLKEAHAQGIVHRDLKPENVMIDAQGNVKIMDFGIARSMEAATRLTGSMVGTPAYMAPEQVSGKSVDYRTDIYSLGLMLYEMFTGAQACQADTPVAAALKQIRETPPPPHEVDPAIPVAIERAILKCLEKDPGKRFQSVADLEKTLSAPGVTGSWPGLVGGPTVLSAPTPVPTPRAAAIATPAGALTSPKTSQPRRAHPAVWTLFGAFLVVAGLAAAHWAKVARQAKATPPPASLPAPAPPAFALKIPAVTLAAPPQGAARRAEAVASRPETKVAGETTTSTRSPVAPDVALDVAAAAPPASTSRKPAEVFPRTELPVKKSARQVQLEEAPLDVQKRADQAFGKTSGGSAANTYLFVGRFERQDRADDAVQRIRKLGLPAASRPRWGWQKRFWVVIAGPFTAARAPDVMQWLKVQGFREAHEVNRPAGLQAGGTQPE